MAFGRAMAAFARSGIFYSCQVQVLLSEWFEKTQLLELYASFPMRTAYDCAPKRHRAQFLCLLNRAAIAEAKRFNDCVRGSWPHIMQTFPELGLWRSLREGIQARVWDSSNEPEPPPPKREKSRRRSRSRRRRDRSGSRNGEGAKRGSADGRSGRSDQDMAANRQKDQAWDSRWTTSDDPGHDFSKYPNSKKTSEQTLRQAIETHPRTGMRACRWGRKWRSAITAVLPSGMESGAPLTDIELRKLATKVWQDIARWAHGSTDAERVLGLFRADQQPPRSFGGDSQVDLAVPRGMEPGTPPAEWAFVPASDILLVVGEGLVGITVEGAFADNLPGHRRLTLAQCYKTPGGKERRSKRDDEKAKRSSRAER